MKIMNIVGARPQFIKYFPIMKALKVPNKEGILKIDDILVHTGQHYDYEMSRAFFDEFSLKEPNYHLNVGSGLHGQQTSDIIKHLEPVLQKEAPDVVLVYGDTNTTLAAAIAASKLHLPLAHVEAGLRSFNKKMPEEINRVLTDHVSTLLFCPGKTAIENLKKEGLSNVVFNGELIDLDYTGSVYASINSPEVYNVGDVMYDVLVHSIQIASQSSSIIEELNLTQNRYCLLTIHRAESTDSPDNFAELVRFINDATSQMRVIMPMHPRTRKVYEHVTTRFKSNVKIIEPVGYFDLISLMQHSSLVMTDSGGMQKEAYWLKVPCVTLRKETEWIETVESGWNILYEDYTGSHSIIRQDTACYGDGKAAVRIVEVIEKYGCFEKKAV